MTSRNFINASATGEIPSYNGDEKSRAIDYANYFCSYAQLYHQKQMLVDHNRMAAYHSAIMGNTHLFKDKIIMDVGTGSGILAVWAAQAGAKKVYAVEYTEMSKHAQKVMEANCVSDVVTVIQGAVEDLSLDEIPTEVDVIISEWMGYFLLRESMLDTIVRARDKFLKKSTGIMFPSHCSMYLAPVRDEEERKNLCGEYQNAMSDWYEFVESTVSTYGVNMSTLEQDYEREQREYYLLSSRWSELQPDAVLAEASLIKKLDMMTCSIDDSRGILPTDQLSNFEFVVNSNQVHGPISGFAGWFTADFKSRTDDESSNAPQVINPSFLSTGPESGYTHWGQQTFYLYSSIPLLQDESTTITGSIEMFRSKDNSRLYDCKIKYCTQRRKLDSSGNNNAIIFNTGATIENLYQIP